MSLDPDDPRPPYRQVANDLRAMILTSRLSPGEQLPSGQQLARRYGVARMTVQQAVRLLRDEGLVVTRQGSGVFVRSRPELPVGFTAHVERAFTAEHVSVDFTGVSVESLAAALAGPLEAIRSGRLAPSSVVVRILVAGVADRDRDPAGGPDRDVAALADAVEELGELGLVPRATAEVRRHGTSPMFTLYVLNERDVFFGFCPVVEAAGGARVPEPMLFHRAGDDPESPDGQYVVHARAWFEAVWTTFGRGGG
ncbi:MAG TPA: GntR family transcriptional regulator [Kineosporiaceae bacterium]